MRHLLVFLFIFLFTTHYALTAFAHSDYVLPYPDVMPGSVWYGSNLAQEMFEKYWYFGNFSQFSYYLKLSDKYLIEAKTLIEYKQYLLGLNSLKKSDLYFSQASKYLWKAKEDGKNISEKYLLQQSAALKHIEVLEKIKNDSPQDIMWTPENDSPTKILLHKALQNAIRIREKL